MSRGPIRGKSEISGVGGERKEGMKEGERLTTRESGEEAGGRGRRRRRRKEQEEEEAERRRTGQW